MISFWRNNSGSLLIPFAIMLPAIVSVLAISINYSQTMRSRALISEASNEGALAIVAIDNKNATEKELALNHQMALRYINYFTTNTIDDSKNDADLKVVYDDPKREYYLTYANQFNMLLTNRDQSMIINNYSDSYGNTRKVFVPTSTDVFFITDFSGSGSCQYNDQSCNSYSQTINDTSRLAMMKSTLTTIVSKYGSDKAFHFSLIPYDIGVPVADSKKNQAGGEAYQCSVMYKLKAPYNSIDYAFWANKNINYMRWSNLKESGGISSYETFDYVNNYQNTVFYSLDSSYYRYYAKIVGPALGLITDAQLLDSGLCIKSHAQDSSNYGSHMYSCGSNDDTYPLAAHNSSIINSQYGNVVQLYDYMFSDSYANDVHYSFANTQTVDVEGTITTLFSDIEQNTITFPRIIAPSYSEYSPFMGMCQAPLFSNKIMTEKMSQMGQTAIHKQAASQLKSFKARPTLIPLTETVSDNQQFVTTIKSSEWRPGGGTDTISALLRTVPEAAKGNGLNKVFIIISDGKDDSGADKLRDDFLDAGLCQAIITGLQSTDNASKKYIKTPAQSVSIHYILTDPKAENITTDAEYTDVYGKWFTQCMDSNKNNLHVATDAGNLTNLINQVLLSETGIFINKNK